MGDRWIYRKDNEAFEYNGNIVPNHYVENSLNAYHISGEAMEKENQELRKERQELAESMLNIIGIVRRVSGDAYRCINHKFIDRLEKLEGGE